MACCGRELELGPQQKFRYSHSCLVHWARVAVRSCGFLESKSSCVKKVGSVVQIEGHGLEVGCKQWFQLWLQSILDPISCPSLYVGAHFILRCIMLFTYLFLYLDHKSFKDKVCIFKNAFFFLFPQRKYMFSIRYLKNKQNEKTSNFLLIFCCCLVAKSCLTLLRPHGL